VEKRLQKILAEAGIASRRESERFIREGRVTVDGRAITALGSKADPDRDLIAVDGKVVRASQPKRYLLLHKPAGYVTTRADPRGRSVVFDLLPREKTRLFTVGRLDYGTEGLLLLTNDGELAHRLLHPRFGCEREYEAEVVGWVRDETLARLRRGVALEDGLALPIKVEIRRRGKEKSLLSLTLGEGRYHEVRRICEAFGHRVLRLRRVRFGPLRLRGLAPGQSRALTPRELALLRAFVGKREA
jgi:pseudouridine synthase